LLIFTGARRLKSTTAAICSISEACMPHALGRTDVMILAKAILVPCFAALFAQSGDMPPTPVAKQTEPFAVKARREGQVGPQPVRQSYRNHIRPSHRCDAPHRASLHAYRLRGIRRLGNILPFRAVVIVIAPGQGTASSGFSASTEANMKGFSTKIQACHPSTD
jgi:hypothetical protein